MKYITISLKYVAGFVGFILLADFIGLLAWIASGQYPADDFFIGTITVHIIKLFF